MSPERLIDPMEPLTAQEILERLRQPDPRYWAANLARAEKHLDEYGYDTLAEFCCGIPLMTGPQRGLGLNARKLEHLLFYDRNYTDTAQELWDQIQKEARIKKVLGIQALADHGEYGRGRPKGNRGAVPENSTSIKRGTEGADYRIARLKRDHPEIAERLEAGEFKTVTAAERAAGVRDPLPKVRRVHFPEDFCKLIDAVAPGADIKVWIMQTCLERLKRGK